MQCVILAGVESPGSNSRALDAAFAWNKSGCRTYPSWFGFMLRVRPPARFSVRDLAAHLKKKRIGNRMLFGGNLARHPVFIQLAKDQPGAFRAMGDLAGADTLMRQAFFPGTYSGLTPAMLD